MSAWMERGRVPVAIFVLAAAVYVAFLGPGRTARSADNDGPHFVYLAQSLLEGRLGVPGAPPGTNDWACYDTQERGPCPADRYRFPADQAQRYRWYVSFPPFPAVLLMPAVALRGTHIPDRLIWAILAGLGPALLFVLLRFAREQGLSDRRPRDDLLLTALLAFGSVYFFSAVQGTVWFAAHVVAVPLICLYVLFSFDARKPAWAGLALGLVFLTRPTAVFLFPFFVWEAVRVSADEFPSTDGAFGKRFRAWGQTIQWLPLLKRLALFSLVPLVCGGLAMWMNAARFDNPFEFGHTYLQMRWRPRVERWGLFNYHYLAKNLAVFLAALPWLSATKPYFMVGRHGLALWVTSPNLFWALWPKTVSARMKALFFSTAVVCLLNLCYQNSGWIQFGYRFALDYLVLVLVLIALSGRRFGVGFIAALVFAIAINTFGALTFNRAWQYYDSDMTQKVIFQPD